MRLMHARNLFIVSIGAVMGALFAVGCAVPEASGQCQVDTDCVARGTVCDTVVSECVEIEQDYSTSAPEGGPSDFTAEAVPFFRGRICTAPSGEIKAGATIPFFIEPCLHPCMDPGEYTYFHQFSCTGGVCTGLTAYYTLADGTACPQEAWGQFPKEQCQYPDEPSKTYLGPITENGNPLEGFLSHEMPYLTLQDMEQIATWTSGEASSECQAQCAGSSNLEGCLKGCFVKELSRKYVQQEERVFDFSLSNAYAAPPQDCSLPESGCECYEIGFQ